MRIFLDIHSKKPWPADQLSNFAPNTFSIDGLEFQCMEGFLQSLKEKDPNLQKEFQTLSGKEAKARGSQIHWQETGLLYWQGKAFSRYGSQYRKLLVRAYDAMTEQSTKFRNTLYITNHCFLWHSIGRFRRSDTCLTTFEFLALLYRERRKVCGRYKKSFLLSWVLKAVEVCGKIILK